MDGGAADRIGSTVVRCPTTTVFTPQRQARAAAFSPFFARYRCSLDRDDISRPHPSPPILCETAARPPLGRVLREAEMRGSRFPSGARFGVPRHGWWVVPICVHITNPPSRMSVRDANIRNCPFSASAESELTRKYVRRDAYSISADVLAKRALTNPAVKPVRRR